MNRILPPWTNVECEECGCEFVATRTEPKTVVGALRCGECDAYARGYEAGRVATADDGGDCNGPGVEP